ncbi:hypothetical protein M427DRAFT_138329 [Gonapodya prolifera JEL478]|uniref:Uncharacterized protein n=1 Tax=Gonapodya prolifera (strain JEL478) TaxID=1344416 RepID=A0A139A3N0_GONPJ|nr:hypothetical protein M427DRAFT_138329 [Gonapodya prolifera JEL478]|eukprot:KXS11390.1 hypothetical protein M427DRAFT_138329 [Gonapodya prolifera JEL478]
MGQRKLSALVTLPTHATQFTPAIPLTRTARVACVNEPNSTHSSHRFLGKEHPRYDSVHLSSLYNRLFIGPLTPPRVQFTTGISLPRPTDSPCDGSPKNLLTGRFAIRAAFHPGIFVLA